MNLAGLCLVEPRAFGYNAETAATNRFQNPSSLHPEAATARARSEFADLVTRLEAAGLRLAIAEDAIEPPCPDAVFPNNWVSFHADGTVVLYPMRDPTRRAERREAVIDTVKRRLGFVEQRRIDLRDEENSGRYLEGTGSLVLDHQSRIAYACRSPRTDEALVQEWCRLLGYEPFVFDAATADGSPVYHTNVLLWIGAAAAGIGLDWVNPAQRRPLLERLAQAGRTQLTFSDTQLRCFAGNMLEVAAPDGALQLAMSAAAAGSLTAGQHSQIVDSGLTPLLASIPTIEQLGGGSVRCMLAEVPVTGKAD